MAKYTLVKGKYFKADGTRMTIGESVELTKDQAAAFAGYFVATSVVEAQAQAELALQEPEPVVEPEKAATATTTPAKAAATATK